MRVLDGFVLVLVCVLALPGLVAGLSAFGLVVVELVFEVDVSAFDELGLGEGS